MGESTLYVDDGVFESQSLTLVHGDGPCQSEGDLLKGAFHHFLDFIGLFVEGKSAVLPRFYSHADFFRRVLRAHHNVFFGDFGDFSQESVEIAMLGRTVVFDEHHLRSAFEGEHFGSGVGTFGKGALNHGAKLVFAGGELLHLVGIDVVGLMIVGDESHIGGARRFEIWTIAGVEALQRVVVGTIVAHGIEEF